MAMLVVLYKAGRWGTGSPAMTMTSLHTGTTDLWTLLTAPMLVLMPLGMHLGLQIPTMMHTHMPILHQMTDGLKGIYASCQLEAAPGWPGLRETLWVSAEVGPTHTAGKTEGTTTCQLGKSPAMLLG